MSQSRMIPVAVLVLLLCSAPTPWAKVHDVLWDVPGDGLQLASISTAKCGDTIRFRCPTHVTHGLYKLEPTNYNGTCPQSYDAPMVGEVLFEPKKACDFSITLQEGPDFFLTSHTAGACQKNLKVYVHTVCIKSENTLASSMFSSLPALPSIRARRRAATDEAQAASLPAAGYAGVVSGLPGDIPAADAVMGGDASPTLGATGGLRAANRAMGGSAADSAVLEAAKQSSAADVRPVLASLMLAAAAVFALLL